jgi:AcrR family transcriptional regulator
MPVSGGRIDDVSADGRHRARRGEGDRLRGEILAAAEALLVETADESAVSIRAIADRVGVTPPSIYRHFADKDALLQSVCRAVFARLDDTLEKAAGDAVDPLDELMRKGHAYVDFGLAHPESYRILFMIHHAYKTAMTAAVDASDLPGSTAFLHLQDTVHRVLELGGPGAPRPDEFAMTCSVWTAVHGITSLRISMPNFPWPSVDEQLALVVEPWRQVLCPVEAKGKAPARNRRRAKSAASGSAARRRAAGEPIAGRSE